MVFSRMCLHFYKCYYAGTLNDVLNFSFNDTFCLEKYIVAKYSLPSELFIAFLNIVSFHKIKEDWKSECPVICPPKLLVEIFLAKERALQRRNGSRLDSREISPGAIG